MVVIVSAYIGGYGEPRRNWDVNTGHLCKVGTFSPEQVLHYACAISFSITKKIHELLGLGVGLLLSCFCHFVLESGYGLLGFSPPLSFSVIVERIEPCLVLSTSVVVITESGRSSFCDLPTPLWWGSSPS